jgi:NAD(P)H-hydrate epimerase
MERITEIPKISRRPRDGHKGSFGKVLIVGGARTYIGAPALAANAALRAGAGLVTMAVPETVQPMIATLAPCATSIPLPENNSGAISEQAIPLLQELVFREAIFDVVAVGPGLGRCYAIIHFIEKLVQHKIPCVIDADALNRLSEIKWKGLLNGPCVITPHPGELARLQQRTISEIQADRETFAMACVEAMKGTAGNSTGEGEAVCLLKGQGTVVTDGGRIYVNASGNPGMATGGCGDVLTGVIAGLMGQKYSPFDAAVLGAYVHGLAGDMAAGEFGEVSMIASDLLTTLPKAFLKIQA